MKYTIDQRGVVTITKFEDRFTEVKSIKKLSDVDTRASQQFVIDAWERE